MNKYLSVLLILLCFVFTGCSSPAKDGPGRLWLEIEGLFPDEVDGIKKENATFDNGHQVIFHDIEGESICMIYFNKKGEITSVSEEYEGEGIPSSYAGWTSGTSYDNWPVILYGTAPHLRPNLDATKKWKNVKKVEINGFTVYKGIKNSEYHMWYVDLEDSFWIVTGCSIDHGNEKFFDDLLMAIDVPTLRSLLNQ